MRASLAQAQQRATEWEQRANMHAAELAEAEAALESANDRAVQLEADHSLVQMQLEEKLDEARVAKVILFFKLQTAFAVTEWEGAISAGSRDRVT